MQDCATAITDDELGARLHLSKGVRSSTGRVDKKTLDDHKTAEGNDEQDQAGLL